MPINNIKIVHIIPCLDRGGAERTVVDLINHASVQIKSQLVSMKKIPIGGKILEQELLQNEKKITVIGQRHPLDILALIKLWWYIRKEKPDIVHTHLFGGDLYGRIAARLAKVPVIVSTEQNINANEGRIRRWIKKRTAPLSQAIVAVSKAVSRNAIAFEGAPVRNIHIIYNSVDVKLFTGKKETQRKVFRIGSLGRLSEQKNHKELISAVKLLPQEREIECLIAGQGNLKENLVEQIQSAHLENRVKLVGLQDDISSFFSQIDIFILPSLWEGLPIVLLEAGAAGLPVIVSDILPHQEIIDNSKNGFLYESGSSQDLANMITYLYEHKAVRDQLGQALRKTVQNKFDVSVMISKYESLYRDLLKAYENTPS